jgi:XTP/dITP diphosphohydrolase
MAAYGRRLFAATGNPDKLREIRQILDNSVWVVVGRPEAGNYPDPDETGSTLAENALIKAREGFRQTGLPSLADDTGLEVDALGGRPGVFSSRYAGENVSYADNVRKLLSDLSGTPKECRAARFRCVMAIVGNGVEDFWEGVSEGEILTDPIGTNGFGYDPVFYSHELVKTFAEASPHEKNSVSHRARALRQLTAELSRLFPDTPTD